MRTLRQGVDYPITPFKGGLARLNLQDGGPPILVGSARVGWNGTREIFVDGVANTVKVQIRPVDGGQHVAKLAPY